MKDSKSRSESAVVPSVPCNKGRIKLAAVEPYDEAIAIQLLNDCKSSSTPNPVTYDKLTWNEAFAFVESSLLGAEARRRKSENIWTFTLNGILAALVGTKFWRTFSNRMDGRILLHTSNDHMDVL